MPRPESPLAALSSPTQAPHGWEGYGAGLLGILVFSLTLPMSRIAVAELDPLLVGLGRALAAAVPAGLLLWLTRSRLPRRDERKGIILAALGVIVGWPLTSTLAMQSVPAAHGAVVNGLLPLSTAAFAALGSGERPTRQFWAWAVAGAALVAAFALREGGGAFQAGDLWLLVSVALGGMGYAEGARVSRTLGGWRTICWALVFSAPFLVAPVAWMATQAPSPSPTVWAALAYLSFGSMFLGFFAWYRGLARGGIARVGQVQLLQPFLTVTAAALLFGEQVGPATLAFALAIIGVIAGGRAAAARGRR
ncbi:DMT family transporter [Bordetella bronchialis]|uniref:Transporter n=1 Tax=Bordetella bronchialis TaxID=463025 RepID=A0A193G1M5_9BORD|nr:DMT family transporter [Bordetella bronchialis]ANN68607.1 transporter [Bordetella bronchialis]ANN73745.1 transporter [Bordetella bronchialis]